MSIRRMTRFATMLLVVLGFAVISSPAETQAAPWTTPGAIAIAPNAAVCDKADMRSRVVCAAAMTNRVLASAGASGVVKKTLIVNDGAAWAWQGKYDLCGYGVTPMVRLLGVHHCDEATFVNLREDAPLLDVQDKVIALLIHESSHGLQERAGIRPVNITLRLMAGVADKSELAPIELGGDCFAGAGMRWLVGNGHRPASAVQQGRHLFDIMEVGDSGGHGTRAQRYAAYDRGANEGVAACNQIIGSNVYPALS